MNWWRFVMKYSVNEEELNSILSSLLFELKTQKEIWKGINVYLAKSFNLVKLLNPANEENKFSDIIRMLLDPDGEHAQGDIFLKLFYQAVLKLSDNINLVSSLNYISLKKAKIIREKVTKEKEEEKFKRLDLLIEPNTASQYDLPAIGLENKIWAPETPRQLEEYFDYLKNKYENFILIFLTPDGREAETSTKEMRKSSKYFECSYRDLLEPWLKECLKECKAEKVRFFIQDFIDWIESFY